jgi:Mor family transcriptional regulator
MKNSSDSFFDSFVAGYAGVLMKHIAGLTEDQALVLAKEAADSLRKKFAGEKLYITKGQFQRRNKDIYERFDGENGQEICREFGLSERRLYQIIHRFDRRGRKGKKT